MSHVAKLLRMKCRRFYILPQQPICGPAEPSLSLTAHFIDETWPLQSSCLQTSYFTSPAHTGDVIAQGLKDAMASWSLPEDRMVFMTTDSGANVIRALRINNWQRLPYFGLRHHIAIGKQCWCFCEIKLKCILLVCLKIQKRIT